MRILIIEDDIALSKGITYHLKLNNYTVDHCEDGLEGLSLAKQSAYDLILLDRLLPSMDGLIVLKYLRQAHIHTPVIIITALSQLNDTIAGLDAGADDYITKPFEINELLARIRAVTRRPSNIQDNILLSFHDISLNISTLVLVGPTYSYPLSKREGAITELFLRYPHTILSRSQILSKVWGPDAPIEDSNIDNYIYFLRRRLTAVGSELKIITHRGIGYRIEVPDV